MIKNMWVNFTLENIASIFLRKSKYIILFTLVLALGAGFYGYQNRRNTYIASTSFYVFSNPNYVYDASVNLTGAELTQAKNMVDSYTQILKSRSFLEKVLQESQLPYSVEQLREAISTKAVANTAVFMVTVFDEVPENAMHIANLIAELAPDEIYRIVKAGGIEVVDYAVLPVSPYASTSVAKYALVGGGAGLLLSIAWFMLRGLSDTTLRRKSDVERLFNIPILGEVPQMNPAKKREAIQKVLEPDAPFAIRDAYSSICMNLRFLAKGEKCPVYAVTSAIPCEGKTLNSINLAISFGLTGKKVLLIDADMRKSSLSDVLGIPPGGGSGLSQYLAGMDDQVQIVETHGIHVLPAGQLPPNPNELLMCPRCKEMFDDCKKRFDVIVVDTSPMGIVPDALGLVEYVTAYLLIVREHFSKFDYEEKAIVKMEQVDAEICGFIYNGVSIKEDSYYEYQKAYQPD